MRKFGLLVLVVGLLVPAAPAAAERREPRGLFSVLAEREQLDPSALPSWRVQDGPVHPDKLVRLLRRPDEAKGPDALAEAWGSRIANLYAGTVGSWVPDRVAGQLVSRQLELGNSPLAGLLETLSVLTIAQLVGTEADASRSASWSSARAAVAKSLADGSWSDRCMRQILRAFEKGSLSGLQDHRCAACTATAALSSEPIKVTWRDLSRPAGKLADPAPSGSVLSSPHWRLLSAKLPIPARGFRVFRDPAKIRTDGEVDPRCEQAQKRLDKVTEFSVDRTLRWLERR